MREGDDADRPRLRHDGPRRAGGDRGAGHRRRGHRPAHARPARHRDDRAVGEEDRPLPRRPRGDAHQRLRRRARRAGAGALLLSPRSADRARDRLRHALSARLEWAYFPGPVRIERGARESDGRTDGSLRIQAARHRRRHCRGRDRRLARQGRRHDRGGPAARRHDDRQGDGRDGNRRSPARCSSWPARSATRCRSARRWR